MAQDFTDSETFDLGEVALSSENTRTSTEVLTVTERNILVIDDGEWEFCPPYDVELVRGGYTVASCGNHGYEEPTQSLRIPAMHDDVDATLPLYQFRLYDGSHAPVDLSGFEAGITFAVTSTTDSFAWENPVEVLDADTGLIQCAIGPATAVDVGNYQARFVLAETQWDQVWTETFTQSNGDLVTVGDVVDSDGMDQIDASGWWLMSSAAGTPQVVSNAFAGNASTDQAFRKVSDAGTLMVTATLSASGDWTYPTDIAQVWVGIVNETNLAGCLMALEATDGGGNPSLSLGVNTSTHLGQVASGGTYKLTATSGGVVRLFDNSDNLLASASRPDFTDPTHVYFAGFSVGATTGGIDNITAYESNTISRFSVPTRPIDLEIIF